MKTFIKFFLMIFSLFLITSYQKSEKVKLIIDTDDSREGDGINALADIETTFYKHPEIPSGCRKRLGEKLFYFILIIVCLMI